MNKSATPATIYIDGENLLYQLIDVLRSQKLINERVELTKIDILALFHAVVAENVQPIKVRYYGTKLHEINDLGKETHETSLIMLKQQVTWAKWLKLQGITFVTAGNLKARRKGENIVFQEKGVDVKIAVDMVQAAYENKQMHFVIVSSDSDIIPAIRIVRERGHKVSYVGLRGSLNKAISAHVDYTFTYTRSRIVENYKRMNQ
jgi:uncharacterized LabA/DUF88 family protein